MKFSPWTVIVLCLPVLLLALVLVPERRLACDDHPYLTETSPDGQWKLTVCPRPMWFAMPGSGSDAPGWIVIRDRSSLIRGVSSLSMLQLYGGAISGNTTEWASDGVSRMMVFDLSLRPVSSPVEGWLNDRLWRLRALLGLVPSDDN